MIERYIRPGLVCDAPWADRNGVIFMWPSTFPALRQQVNRHPLTFLDSAATTLRPQSVIDALVDYYSTDNANPSRVHTLASRAADRLSAAQVLEDLLHEHIRAAQRQLDRAIRRHRTADKGQRAATQKS